MKTTLKNTTIVYVLKILYNYSSYDFPVTQTAIANYLNDIDISCSRKTVGRNLKYLIDMGLPIKRKQSKSGGYYYDFENDNFFVKYKIGEKENKNERI